MLIGVILGDAHIGKTGLNKAFISFEQSKSKINYLNYLQTLTKEGGLPLLDDTIKEYSREDLRYNNNTNSLYFINQSLEVLRPLANQFLDDNGKKIIPTNIAELLTPKSLAFWIMDDGQQVKRGGVTLCTDSFKTDEIKILSNTLKINFYLDTSIHIKKGKNETIYERIYIKKEGLEELKPTLKLYMHESMLYKINENTLIKQDYSELESGSEIDNLDLFEF